MHAERSKRGKFTLQREVTYGAHGTFSRTVSEFDVWEANSFVFED